MKSSVKFNKRQQVRPPASVTFCAKPAQNAPLTSGACAERYVLQGVSLFMSKTDDKIWRQYYEKSLAKSHAPRTEFAIKLNDSDVKVAIDLGCGTGCDTSYISRLGYEVQSFDNNPDSIAICVERFGDEPLVTIRESSFENFEYPRCGVVIANSSLYFADPDLFIVTWKRIVDSIEPGGVFAGDFMGVKDSWASGFRSPTTPMSKLEVEDLFNNFEIVRFHERDEIGKTAIGKTKHWHTFSVVAIKRT
ncbi:class I SAM-dependent methyltransferase [Shewanella sp. 0m-11]